MTNQEPKPPVEVGQWTQGDDDDLRDQADPLRVARAIIWALVMSIVLMASLAVIVKVAMLLIGWIRS
jgi:hypothetical protein